MGHPPLKSHRRALAAALALLFLATGCTAVGQARRLLREPGQKLIDLPENVAVDYQCASRRLPYLAIEDQEVASPLSKPSAKTRVEPGVAAPKRTACGEPGWNSPSCTKLGDGG